MQKPFFLTFTRAENIALTFRTLINVFVVRVNADKCNLTKLTTKRSWYLSNGQRSAVGRAGSVHPSIVACFSVAYRSGFVAELGYPSDFILPSPPLPFPFFHCLAQCDRCLDDCLWGLMAGLRGLPAMGAFHCLGAG